ncbi:MAG TPA: ABC transporter permease [Burkholderiaceae bacterium]|nr:ABC transporter permease [Burkholderiaceae bacterium]
MDPTRGAMAAMDAGGRTAAMTGGRHPFDVQRSVLYALVLRELKTRFGGRWLGVYWAVFDPLAQVAVLTVLLGGFHRAVLPGIDYPVFLVTGMVPFYMFRNLSLRLMDGVDANRALFSYRQVKPIDTLVARALLEVGVYAVISLIMFGIFSAFGMAWTPYQPLQTLVLGGLLVGFGFGLGLFLAVATDSFHQSRAIVRVIFLPLYLMSGVLTPLHVIPVEWRPVLMLNPMVHALELSRAYFLPNYRVAEGASLGYVACSSLVALAAGLALHHVRRHELLSD